jgi:hypothetical protein
MDPGPPDSREVTEWFTVLPQVAVKRERPLALKFRSPETGAGLALAKSS